MSTVGLRTPTLMAATITLGLVTGVFTLYAHTIMPGLHRTDDRTFVGAFQSIDRAIVNPWFIGASFLDALALTALAAFTNRGQPAFPWITAALIAYVAAVAITVTVHVPLNDAIKAAGHPDRDMNVALVRTAFNETKWATWNLARAVTSTCAFASCAWALILHGRSTA